MENKNKKMLETLSESYVQQVPAFKRKMNCKTCGQVFFKKVPFQELCGECLAGEIDKEFHNADLMQDECEEIDLNEVMEAQKYAEKAEREKQQTYENGLL